MTFIHLPFSVRLLDHFVASVVFMKDTVTKWPTYYSLQFSAVLQLPINPLLRELQTITQLHYIGSVVSFKIHGITRKLKTIVVAKWLFQVLVTPAGFLTVTVLNCW